MAPLQKRAWYGLGVGTIWVLAIVILFIVKGGFTNFHEDQSFRLIFAGLLIGGGIAYVIVMNLAPLKKAGQIDERDMLIMGKAPKVQFIAVLLSLVIWSVALTESYWDEGQIPVVFPYLVVNTTLIVSVLAQSVGILIGYGRGVNNDECC